MKLTGCQIKLDWNDSSKGFKMRKNTKSSLFLDFWKGSQRLGSDVRMRASRPVSTRPQRPCSLLLQFKVLFQRGKGIIGMVPNKPLPTPPTMSIKPSEQHSEFSRSWKTHASGLGWGIQSHRNKRHDSLFSTSKQKPPWRNFRSSKTGQSENNRRPIRRVGKVTLPF